MGEEMKPSRRHAARTQIRKQDPWWLRQFKERPVAGLGILVSSIGGLLLLLFFARLGRFPDLDLAGAGALLMAVAVVGVLLTLTLTAGAVGAGLALRGEEVKGVQLKDRTTIALLMLPGFLSAVVLSVYVYVAPDAELPWWWYSVPLTLLLVVSAVHTARLPQQELAVPDVWGRSVEYFTRIVSFASVGFMWLTAAGFAFLMFAVMYPPDGDRLRLLIGMVLWTAWCYACNIAVALVVKANTAALVGGGILVSLLMLLNLTGNWTGLPAAVLGALGLGEVPASLVVTREGCDYLNKAAGKQVVCRLGTDGQTAKVCPVILRSRIGTPYYVELSPYDKDGRWPQLHVAEKWQAIAVPKADVPSWTQLKPMNRADRRPAAEQSQRVVSYLDLADNNVWLREQCGDGQ